MAIAWQSTLRIGSISIVRLRLGAEPLDLVDDLHHLLHVLRVAAEHEHVEAVEHFNLHRAEQPGVTLAFRRSFGGRCCGRRQSWAAATAGAAPSRGWKSIAANGGPAGCGPVELRITSATCWMLADGADFNGSTRTSLPPASLGLSRTWINRANAPTSRAGAFHIHLARSWDRSSRRYRRPTAPSGIASPAAVAAGIAEQADCPRCSTKLGRSAAAVA